MTNPLQGPDEETPLTFAEMISQLEMCTHMNVTSTNPDESQQWHARRNKARLALLAKLDSLESALREAQSQIAHFRAGMVNYGHHTQRCNAMRSAGPCGCGFHAALDKFATKGRT